MNNHPKWLSHIFQRGRLNHQPDWMAILEYPLLWETSDKARCIYSYRELCIGLKLQILNDTARNYGNPMIYGWKKTKLGKMRRNMKQYLVGGLEHEFYFSIQLGIIIPIDFHILPRGWNHQPENIYMFSNFMCISCWSCSYARGFFGEKTSWTSMATLYTIW